MGHPNQLLYATQFVGVKPKRILEVGSKNYGNTVQFRGIFPCEEYVGADLEDGEGVDVVLDLTASTGDLKPFDLILCCSVLEHVRKPWKMAENLAALLNPGGELYLAVPWVWRFHAYPSDYFRYSWEGIKELFPELEWRDFHFSSTTKGRFWRCKPEADNARAVIHEGDKYLPYMEIHGIGRK